MRVKSKMGERGRKVGQGADLLETADPREAVQCSTELIAVKDTKVSEPQRQLAVGALAVAEHHTVTGAVHGLGRVRGFRSKQRCI